MVTGLWKYGNREKLSSGGKEQKKTIECRWKIVNTKGVRVKAIESG